MSSMPEYIFIIFTMIIAGFIQGMTGFGFSLIAIPIMATFINIKQAVPLSVSIALITVIIMSFQLRGHLNWKRLIPMVVGLVPGIAIGAFLLKNLPDNIIKFIMGIFLLIFSIYNLFKKNIEIRLSYHWGIIAGFLSGLISATIGGGGLPVVVYTSVSKWTQNEIKATLSFFFVGMAALTVVAHALSGLINISVIKMMMYSTPAALFGLFFGILSSARINRNVYLKTVNIILAILGCMTLYEII